MNNLIKNALENGRLLVLLGAGASTGSENSRGESPPLGEGLAKELAKAADFEYSGEALSDVYDACKDVLGVRLEGVLEELFKHCKPSSELVTIMKHPIPRIYTLNIDDSVEKAAAVVGKRLNVRRRNDTLKEMDRYFSSFELIKLNGDINCLKEGLIFSSREYASESSEEPLWYSELARDYSNYTFLFIGSKLKEPLFQQEVEKYRRRVGARAGKSYLLVPNLTAIEKRSLESSNIDHIEGTLKSFSDWLSTNYPEPLTSAQLMKQISPHSNLIKDSSSEEDSILKGVTLVHRASLSLVSDRQRVGIRTFYKGFKPEWQDVLDGVPAFLTKAKIWFESTLIKAQPNQLHMLFGIAGSGKTTALMQIALKLSEVTPCNVYFVDEYRDDTKSLIMRLEEINSKPYFLIFDRPAHIAPSLAQVIASGAAENAIFISAENPSIWNSKVREHLGEFESTSTNISTLDDLDAEPILEKIRQYGNWTRLQKLNKRERKRELLKRAKNQLLIGLLEATSGDGYLQIIERDYRRIESRAEKDLLILAGFATQKRVAAGEANLTRALHYLGHNLNVQEMCSRMDGLLTYRNGFITTRHRTYIDKLFSNYVDQDLLLKVLKAYIKAFSVFDFPIVMNISRTEAEIYKHLVNFKVLKRLFFKVEENILSVYKEFEKTFEHEGLFLMQYGLALRHFDKMEDAYEKLHTAHDAFPESPQITHALAQQKLIIAENADSRTRAMTLLDEAIDSLNQLSSGNVRIYDRYPIITLSEGHVKVLHSQGMYEEAQTVAAQYFGRLDKDTSLQNHERVQQTKASLMKYYTSGEWRAED